MSRCLCGHELWNGGHYQQRGKWVCTSVVCGCAEPRPDTRPRDDRWDDLEPRRRQDMGSVRVDSFPEPWEVAE
jgi:hypothetical protein